MKVKAIFRAKIDWWLFIPVYLILIYPMVIGIMEEKWLLVIIMVITFLFMTQLTIFTRYLITLKDELFVQIGYFGGTKILISNIETIRNTRIALVSPAPSLDRIEIKYGKYSSIVISPLNKEKFKQYLREINPKIELIR